MLSRPLNNTIISLIKNARYTFLEGSTNNLKRLSNNVSLFTQDINGKKYRVFGIKKENQNKIDFNKLRGEISKELGFAGTKKFMQVIGDSAAFSKAGTAYGRKFIPKYLSNNENSIMLYGLTGNVSHDGSQADVNQLVSEYIDNEPEQAKRFIANVVDFHSILAMEKWGSTVPNHINNFFLVYTDGPEPSAKFGDDIIVSDGLTNDKALCLGGGVQTLRQMNAMLKNDVKMDAVNGLRNDSTDTLPLLSATEFFMGLKNHLASHHTTKEHAASFVHSYLQKHTLFDVARPDSGTKEALFQATMDQFYQDEIWKKLHLIQHHCTSKIQSFISYVGMFAFAPALKKQTPHFDTEPKCKL